jgi:small subunit ribosomal protein S9
MADDEKQPEETGAEEDVEATEADAPAEEAAEPAEAEAPAEAAAEPAAEPEAEAPAEPEAEAEPAAEPEAEAPAEPAAEEAPAAEPKERKPRAKKSDGDAETKPDVVPGAHLEPDLVLDQPRDENEFGQYQEVEGEETGEPAEGEEEQAPAPVAASPLELAADARYHATGKRKTSVARVILKPGKGEYKINGRVLEEYFPRSPLQTLVRAPLETTGNQERMDVVAKIHGGGVAAQAGALRHGVARALVEADPNLRSELKRRGFLTRDARVKERKKAGLKKARKRPQFSKR